MKYQLGIHQLMLPISDITDIITRSYEHELERYCSSTCFADVSADAMSLVYGYLRGKKSKINHNPTNALKLLYDCITVVISGSESPPFHLDRGDDLLVKIINYRVIFIDMKRIFVYLFTSESQGQLLSYIKHKSPDHHGFRYFGNGVVANVENRVAYKLTGNCFTPCDVPFENKMGKIVLPCGALLASNGQVSANGKTYTTDWVSDDYDTAIVDDYGNQYQIGCPRFPVYCLLSSGRSEFARLSWPY